MSLEKSIKSEEKIKNIFGKTRHLFASKKEKTLDYLINKDKDIAKYFSKNVPDDMRAKYESILRQVIDNTFTKYDKYLKSIYRKGGKVLGGLTLMYDAWQSFTKFPSPYAGAMHSIGVLAKSIVEIPLLYKYIKGTSDLMAVPKWIGYKIIELIPIIGPVVGYKGLEKIITNNAKKHTKKEFLKIVNKYIPLERFIEEKVKKKTGFIPKPIYTSEIAA